MDMESIIGQLIIHDTKLERLDFPKLELILGTKGEQKTFYFIFIDCPGIKEDTVGSGDEYQPAAEGVRVRAPI